MTTRLWWGGAFVALVVSATFPGDAAAARSLSFTILLDGKEYLVGRGDDNGDAPADVVWRRLSTTELTPVEGVKVKVDPGDPLRATLRGEIAIDVSHGGKAAVAELHLVRQSPTAGWTVFSEDVEKIARDIGLSESSPAAAPSAPPAADQASATPKSQQSPWVWVGAGLAMSLFASGLLVTWLRRRMPPPIPLADRAEPPFADAE